MVKRLAVLYLMTEFNNTLNQLKMKTQQNHQISDVSETSTLTIYCHAMESQSKNPILKDPNAEEIVKELDKFISPPQTKPAKKLLKTKLDQKMSISLLTTKHSMDFR